METKLPAKEATMAVTLTKRIALFSDGTGNSSAKAQKTNVWRLFQAVDQSKPDQIAMYDDGVGTSSNMYLAALGGAFGWGLKRNVIDLYKFVCRNYVQGDELYGFGFSRGAFTIRVLVGLIVREGLVTFRSEAELDHRAAAAYRHFRYLAFPGKSPLIWVSRKLRDLCLAVMDTLLGRHNYSDIAKETRAAQRDTIPIRFLGLWDTVEAYGLPIAALKRGIDWLLWPMLFGDLKLASCVRRAVHALSLDDERTTFHPILWDEEWEARSAAAGLIEAGRITQVWFAGVHSNVGGGYPEDQLSLVPLEWIMGEAAKNGLSLVAQSATELRTTGSPYARLYDSRAGLASYYRYAPRLTPVWRHGGTPLLANVHWSVIMRMVYGSDSYAPVTLPHNFNVLMPTGGFLPFDELQRSFRDKPHFTTGDTALDSALCKLRTPDHNEVGLVWDTVFWRSCLYLLTMALTLAAAAFPWVSKLKPQILGTWERAAGGGPLTTLVDASSLLVPSFATPWKQALKDSPLEFGALLIGITLSLIGSQTLEGRIHDRARLVWHAGSVDSYRTWRAQNRAEFVRLIMIGLLLVAAATLTCFLIGVPNVLTTLMVTALLLLLTLGASSIGFRGSKSPETRVRNTVALSVARLLRKSPLLVGLYGGLTQKIIPVVFAVLLVIVGISFINRAVFDTLNSAGFYCAGSVNVGAGAVTEPVWSKGTFTTSNRCWASGLVLKQGHRYVITIATATDPATDRWFDRDVPTDPLGFSSHSLQHWLARPLTRWWYQNWFKPVARIGRFGNDEYVLDPIDDIAPWPEPDCLAAYHSARDLPQYEPITLTLAKALNACAPVPADRLILHSVIKPQYDGELFLYVNDAVIGIPGLPAIFYNNNSGSASVRVEPLTSRAVQTELPSRAVPVNSGADLTQ
jgi:uncharacterized protein (DUF2235 family)